MEKTETLKEGYIYDYISGKQVKGTPEEVEAVQVFSQQLVEDYGYPKNHIQTHPQFRVKVRPSDTKKEYPVDIAVFTSESKDDDSIFLIVECKKKNRKDGRSQLEDYLRFSKASLGVWFNGSERFYIQKIEKGGKVLFREIPNIPRYGERLEDIGLFKRKDLKPTHNLKASFKSIRNYLAANAVGATRDEVLAQQLINIIFCKIYDEKFTEPEETVKFHAGIDEDAEIVKKRIEELFKIVKKKYKEVFKSDDSITLNATDISFIVGELQNYCIVDAERDVLADSFETFIDHALKGGQGQFFTPRNVVKMMVELLDPEDTDLIIDPACGSGGFLIESLRHLWAKLQVKADRYGWTGDNLAEEKRDIANKCIRGIDKDYFLSKISKAYMAIMGDGKGGLFCEDSLEKPSNWNAKTQQKITLGTFSVVLTNPPFGAKIPVSGEEKLGQYELGHKWKLNKKTNQWEIGNLRTKEAPQVLFIERCVQLLREGGRLAIVLPEGTFGNPTDRYIWQYILDNTIVDAIISTPAETFQPNTHFKTSILIAHKGQATEEYPIFMGIADTCGHNKNGKDIFKINLDGTPILDSEGNKIPDDEFPEIVKRYKAYKAGELEESRFGFVITSKQIKNFIYIPNYYDPELYQTLDEIKNSKEFYTKSIGELIAEKVLTCKRGNEIGSQFYGMGDIPFIRTSDIVNWELKIDPTKSVPEEVYQKYKKNQNVKAGDILFVKDGTFLIGNSAIVTKATETIIIQSHIIKVRVNDNSIINSYYLLYLLNLPIVQQQIAKFTFIQGTLSTVGDRFNEIRLPIHRDPAVIQEITEKIKEIITAKEELQKKIISLMNK